MLHGPDQRPYLVATREWRCEVVKDNPHSRKYPNQQAPNHSELKSSKEEQQLAERDAMRRHNAALLPCHIYAGSNVGDLWKIGFIIE